MKQHLFYHEVDTALHTNWMFPQSAS